MCADSLEHCGIGIATMLWLVSAAAARSRCTCAYEDIGADVSPIIRAPTDHVRELRYAQVAEGFDAQCQPFRLSLHDGDHMQLCRQESQPGINA